MSCHEMREFLDAYMDRELDVVTAVEFERHLEECSACRAICRQYQDLHDSVRARLPYFQSPPELEGKIQIQLRSDSRVRDRAIQKHPFPRSRAWALAAAIALLLIFSAALFRTLGHSPASQLLADQVVSSHIRSLMANHLTDVVSSDQHTVKPWFSGKLDFAPVVKDLSSEGFSLVGGRLDYLNNRPVAALVYKRRQHIINLFLWPSSQSDSAPRSTTINGYNVVHGIQSHMAYWAVSDLNAGELKQFVEYVRH
jgi:anti-sigma factor RsiW